MRRTRFGALLYWTGWACMPIALVANTFAPALVGALLVALVVTARPSEGSVQATRRVDSRIVAGRDAEAVTIATGPPGAPLFLEEETPPGVTVKSTSLRAERGRCELRTTFTCSEVGAQAWKRVRARVQDSWGLVEDEVVIPVTSVFQVQPEPGLLSGTRLHNPDLAKKSRANRGFDWEPEIERLRDYQPGDRFRDVDWAHTAKLGHLIAREYRREAPLPVVVLLQADVTMRQRRRVSKLSNASRVGLAVAAAIHRARLPVGFIAWTERGVEAQVRATTNARALHEAMQRVAGLPPTLGVTAPAPLTVAVREDTPPTSQERAFLQSIAVFMPRAASGVTPIEAAVAAVSASSPHPCLVLAFLDAEENPQLVRTLARRLKARGHRLVVAAPASGAHHYAFDDVDDAAADRLVEWRRRREQARAYCRSERIPYLVLGPGRHDASAQEVLACVR